MKNKYLESVNNKDKGNKCVSNPIINLKNTFYNQPEVVMQNSTGDVSFRHT